MLYTAKLLIIWGFGLMLITALGLMAYERRTRARLASYLTISEKSWDVQAEAALNDGTEIHSILEWTEN